MSKSPKAFRSISEAAEEVGVPQHVLRFWETKFDFITPVKRAGGRRFYRPEDIETLKAVRRLLHDEGMTIKGVQRVYKDKGRSSSLAGAAVIEMVPSSQIAQGSVDKARLEETLAQIEAARKRLEAALRR